jgi:ADP-ribosylglycohydrolase
MTATDRSVACLQGVACGDAIGKQTEMLSHHDVNRYYPCGIRGFEGAPGTTIPRYASNRKREWRIGETTDDTERTIAVARAIISDRGVVAHTTVGREMLRCTKCVHPGVKSLWEFHRANDPGRMANEHDGCGAAIRVAPVGILYGSNRLDEIVASAREASIPTHGGSVAIAAAAATAAAVSAAIDGGTQRDIIAHAARAATEAERRWPGRTPASFARIIRDVHDDLSAVPLLRPADLAARYFPDQPMTIVPLALGLATVLRSAEEGILIAANIGGDSDSVASIAGGILGAAYPETLNRGWCEVVEQVNQHNIEALARSLAPLRH